MMPHHPVGGGRSLAFQGTVAKTPQYFLVSLFRSEPAQSSAFRCFLPNGRCKCLFIHEFVNFCWKGLTVAVAPSKAANQQAEQANALVTKWADSAPNLLKIALSNKILTIHSAQIERLLYALDWTDDLVTLHVPGTIHEPYYFHDVNNSLIFLDALLWHYVVRQDELAATIANPSMMLVKRLASF